MKNVFRFITAILVFVTVSGCANSLFYHPTDQVYLTPEDAALSYENVYFESMDGTKLHGWFIPAREKAWGTLVHFHGNAGNITANLKMVSFFPYQGLNVFMFDYRGYGKSQGHPYRKGVYEDSLSAVRYVVSRKDVDKESLFFLGQSLGGANAIAVASLGRDIALRAVVIDSSFYSYRSIVRDKIAEIPVLSWFKTPLSFMMATDSFHSGDMIGSISPTPLMIIHGTSDRIVPYHHGVELFERANEPKLLVTIDGGDHISALMPQHLEFRQKILDFFRRSGHYTE